MNEISFEMLKEKGCPGSLLFYYTQLVKPLNLSWLITSIKNSILLRDCFEPAIIDGWILWLKENFEPKPVHKIGNRYRTGNAEYLLCATGLSKVTLVDLKDGRYWHINTEVRNPFGLTEYEFKTVCDGSEFELIPEGGGK